MENPAILNQSNFPEHNSFEHYSKAGQGNCRLVAGFTIRIVCIGLLVHPSVGPSVCWSIRLLVHHAVEVFAKKPSKLHHCPSTRDWCCRVNGLVLEVCILTICWPTNWKKLFLQNLQIIEYEIWPVTTPYYRWKTILIQHLTGVQVPWKPGNEGNE